MAIVPMICVESVSATSAILSRVFGWTSTHGGDEFDELIDSDKTRMLWLHCMHAPEHPRFAGNSPGILGRGLALYVFVADLEAVHERTKGAELTIVEDLAKNPSAGFREFTFADPDGYHFSVAERPSW